MLGFADDGHACTGVLAATLTSAELLALDLLVVMAAALFAIAAGLTAPGRDQRLALERQECWRSCGCRAGAAEPGEAYKRPHHKPRSRT